MVVLGAETHLNLHDPKRTHLNSSRMDFWAPYTPSSRPNNHFKNPTNYRCMAFVPYVSMVFFALLIDRNVCQDDELTTTIPA